MYRHLHDDFAPEREAWEPIDHPQVLYVECRDERDELIGMFIINIHSRVEIELHEAFLPSAWGRKARRCAAEFREWIWRETPFERVIGKILASNPTALSYARAAGMEVFGVDPRSFMKDGMLQDQIWVGASRPGAV